MMYRSARTEIGVPLAVPTIAERALRIGEVTHDLPDTPFLRRVAMRLAPGDDRGGDSTKLGCLRPEDGEHIALRHPADVTGMEWIVLGCGRSLDRHGNSSAEDDQSAIA